MQMNVFVCTSRGKALEPYLSRHMNSPYLIHTLPGASLQSISIRTQQIIRKLENDNIKNASFYIIAGLPDITKRLKIFKSNYEEVIFDGDSDNISDKIMRDIHRLADIIQANNHKFIMCPIIPSNIEKWNSCRLSQRKTSHLNYSSSYPDMQAKLHSTILQVNKEIISFNTGNSVITPFIATGIIVSYKRKPSLPTSHKFSYKHLPDGVHLDSTIANQIAIKLVQCTQKNDNYVDKPKVANPDTEGSSLRRSWRL